MFSKMFTLGTIIIVFGILGHLNIGADACAAAAEDCLLTDLFQNYEVYARPVALPTDTVEVLLSFRPTSLISIDEKNELMNLVGIVSATWSDPRLSWNSSAYSGAQVLNIRASHIWLPDLALYNSADTFYHKTHREDFFAFLTSSGIINWSFGGIFSTTCSLDIAHYPFDSQTCTLSIRSWGYTSTSVNINVEEDIDFSTFSSSSLWSNESASATRTEAAVGDDEVYPGVDFSITWKRKPLYYHFNIITPVVMLLIVSLGMFWLPPDCGERMSLAITVLLSFAVFLIVIMDNTPTNSETLPVISEFVMAVMMGTTLILLESLVIVGLSFQSGRPPRWLRKFAFVYLARIFCAKNEVPEVEDKKEDHSSSNQSVPKLTDMEDGSGKPKEKPPLARNEMDAILESVKAMQRILEDKVTSEAYTGEWKLVAKLLDRLLFWIFLVSIIIAIIVLFAVVA